MSTSQTVTVPQIKIFHSDNLEDLQRRVNNYLLKSATGEFEKPFQHIKVEVQALSDRQERRVYYLDTTITQTINLNLYPSAGYYTINGWSGNQSGSRTASPNISPGTLNPNNPANNR